MELFFILTGIFLLLVYTILILHFAWNCHHLFRRPPPAPSEDKVSFAVVIPFRNELANLPALLQGLQLLDYPRDYFEVILVDDGSDDGSAGWLEREIEKVSTLRISCISNTGSGKKQAIECAVDQTSAPYIVISDADCRFSPYWLTVLNNFLHARPNDLVIMPVVNEKAKHWFGHMQDLEFMSLIGCTFGAGKHPFLCNGANLCFSRETFLKVRPFHSNYHIRTGDDIFLLHAFKRRGFAIGMLADSGVWVKTSVKDSFKGFWKQRTRWGSKAINYGDPFSLFMAILILLTNTWLACGMLGLFIFSDLFLFFWLSAFLLKSVADLVLLSNTTRFFRKGYLMRFFPFVLVLYIFYVPLAALSGIFYNIAFYRRK